MSLVFLDNPRLYTDFTYFQSQFNWNVNEDISQPMTYHCYWAGALSALHELSLKSLMITQSLPFEVWVWMPPDDISRNRNFIASMQRVPAIRFKAYIPEDESKGTEFEQHLELLNGEDQFQPRKWKGLSGVITSVTNALRMRSFLKDKNGLKWRKLANRANAFRILVLRKYGGIYFDLDTLFLKDFRPLCHVEFFYQWSDQRYGNNAILHFFKNSTNIRALAERSIEIKSCRSMSLLKFKALSEIMEGVYVFPSFLFDPLWIAHDRNKIINNYCNRFKDFFTSESSITLSEFFPGAYAYHWHNRWGWPIRRGTIIGHLNDEVQKAFNAKFQSR